MHKPKHKKNTFFEKYYFLMFIWGWFGLLSGVLGLYEAQVLESLTYNAIITIATFVVIILSILAIVRFGEEKRPKITLIIPLYHIIFFALTFLGGAVYGFIRGFRSAMNNISPDELITSLYTDVLPFFSVVAIVSSLFEIILVLYVLYKYYYCTRVRSIRR